MSTADSFAHRDELLTAAIREFSERGYEKASLNRILAAAAMSKGQYYHHFDGKQSLYLWVVDRLIERKLAHLGTVEPPSDADFFTMLRYLLDMAARLLTGDPELDGFARSFLRERGSTIFDAAMSAHPFASNQAVVALVAAGFERGDFRTDLDREFVEKIVAYHFDHLVELFDLSSTAQLDAVMDDLVAFLRRGLGR